MSKYHFVELLEQGRLQLRKTLNRITKLYLFRLDEAGQT